MIKTSILDNVRIGKPETSKKEVMQALKAAQCMDIIVKLPKGVDTVIGTNSVYLSGGEQQRVFTARAICKIQIYVISPQVLWTVKQVCRY